MWTFTLKATHAKGDEITAERLAEFSGSSVRSARDLLSTMKDYGILEVERDGNTLVYSADPEYFDFIEP